MKIYTIVTPHQSLMKKKLADVLKLCHIPPTDTMTYDMEDVALTEALYDVTAVGFLSPQKAVVVKNPYFLTATLPKGGPEHDLDKLTDYLNNPSPDNVLIFMCPYEKLDERKKIVKLLKKKSDFVKIDVPAANELIAYTRKTLNNANIEATADVMNQLVAMTKGNVDKLINELNKIKDFFLDSDTRKLTGDLLQALVSVTLEDNVFLLTEALGQKNVKLAYQIFEDLLTQKEEPIKLIILIANQFRLFKQVSQLQKKGMYEREIATQLGVHPYRVKVAMGQARRFTMGELDEMIAQLAQIDLGIKQGRAEGKMALELFILGLA